MKRPAGFLTRAAAIAALACVATARGDAPPRDLPALERWALDNLHCRADFVEQVQDRAFLDGVRKLGVKFETEWVEGDLPEGDITLPAPIALGGHPVQRIRYWADSGAEFYAFVAAPAEELAKALGAGAVPAARKGEFDERTIAVRFARKASRDQRLPPAIFVRRAEAPGTSEAGCRYFDG